MEKQDYDIGMQAVDIYQRSVAKKEAALSSAKRSILNSIRKMFSFGTNVAEKSRSELTPLEEHPVWEDIKNRGFFETLCNQLTPEEQNQFLTLAHTIVDVNKAAGEGSLDLLVQDVKGILNQSEVEFFVNQGRHPMSETIPYIVVGDNLKGASIPFIPTYSYARNYLSSRLLENLGRYTFWVRGDNYRFVNEDGESIGRSDYKPKGNTIVQGWKPGLAQWSISDIITMYSPESHVVDGNVTIPCKGKDEGIKAVQKLKESLINRFIPSHQSPVFFDAEGLLLKGYERAVINGLMQNYNDRVTTLKELVGTSPARI